MASSIKYRLIFTPLTTAVACLVAGFALHEAVVKKIGLDRNAYVRQVAQCLPSVCSGDISTLSRTDEYWTGKYTTLVAQHYAGCVTNDVHTMDQLREEFYIRKKALQALNDLVPAIDAYNSFVASILIVISSLFLIALGLIVCLFTLLPSTSQTSSQMKKQVAKLERDIAALKKKNGV